MQSFRFFGLLGAGLGLLFLGACSSGSQTTTANSPAASQSVAASPAVTPASGDAKAGDAKTEPTMAMGGKDDKHSEAQAGGQVIESGPYHLEFVPEKEAKLSHLDFYLLKGDTHTPVPNAQITAQVQLPDGSQTSLPMTYDPSEKHYTAKLPGAAPGAYKVAILSDIQGEKVNGRFSFSR